MNPQFDKPAGFDLPPPLPEAMPSSSEALPPLPVMEQVSPPAPLAQPPVPAPAPAPLMAVSNPPVAASPAGVPPATNPAAAADNDLIEKEWVAKAKAIIAQTREDPFSQSTQIAAVKADYLKKRYNKDVKLPTE